MRQRTSSVNYSVKRWVGHNRFIECYFTTESPFKCQPFSFSAQRPEVSSSYHVVQTKRTSVFDEISDKSESQLPGLRLLRELFSDAICFGLRADCRHDRVSAVQQLSDDVRRGIARTTYDVEQIEQDISTSSIKSLTLGHNLARGMEEGKIPVTRARIISI